MYLIHLTKKNKMSFLHRQQLFCLHAVRNALKMKCSYCKWLLHKTFGGGKFRTLYQFQNYKYQIK